MLWVLITVIIRVNTDVEWSMKYIKNNYLSDQLD